MSFASLLILALGLAMDATAVSAARGFAVPRVSPRHALIVALFFGGFQGGMPVLGWLLGTQFGGFVQAWDHWIAFGLLTAIGAKMIGEAAKTDDVAERADADLFGWKVMTVLAIATSIDALAVGVTLPMLGAPLALSAVTIGVTTAMASALGLYAGRRFGALLGRRLDVVGGLVLIALGTKILIEHLLA